MCKHCFHNCRQCFHFAYFKVLLLVLLLAETKLGKEKFKMDTILSVFPTFKTPTS